MFPNSVIQASTSFFNRDLMICAAFDSINHFLADTCVFRCKNDASTWGIDKCGGVGEEAGRYSRTGHRGTYRGPHQQ